MKKNTATVAVALGPYEIFDAEARGVYNEGEVIQGERAAFLLERYPTSFRAGKPSEAPVEEAK